MSNYIGLRFHIEASKCPPVQTCNVLSQRQGLMLDGPLLSTWQFLCHSCLYWSRLPIFIRTSNLILYSWTVLICSLQPRCSQLEQPNQPPVPLPTPQACPQAGHEEKQHRQSCIMCWSWKGSAWATSTQSALTHHGLPGINSSLEPPHFKHDQFILPILETMPVFCFYLITPENQSFRHWCELLYLEEY